MMWNWLVSVLGIGASIVLYDGSPLVPSANVLWDLIDQIGYGFLDSFNIVKYIPYTHRVKTLHTSYTRFRMIFLKRLSSPITEILIQLCHF